MRVAVFSMGPVFPNHVHGGSQKTLGSIVKHLGEIGAQVSLYCTRRDDNSEPFALGKSVTVYPVLRYKQTYPEPHYTAPYNLASVVQTLSTAADTHDRFYVHDGELLYSFIYESTPAVVSVQDFVYPDTLAGALSFRRDHLVVSSDYVRKCVQQTFQVFRPLPSDAISVANNGFDRDEMKRCDSSSLRHELGLAGDDIAVLYPHRPDPRKGIWESLQALLAALEQLPAQLASRVRLLVPEWVDSNVANETDHIYQSIYADIKKHATEAGWPGLVQVHPWLPVARMAEYYSLGCVTLCIGSFVEAFGNVSVESQLCGTPAIVSRVAAQRTVLPESLVRKVDHGDVKAVSDLLVSCLKGEITVDANFGEYIEVHYSHEQMVRTYASAICNAKISNALDAYRLPPTATQAVSLPAWCAPLSSGLYNDYAYGYATDPQLQNVARRVADGPVLCRDLTGVGEAEIRRWIADGFLVPAEVKA